MSLLYVWSHGREVYDTTTFTDMVNFEQFLADIDTHKSEIWYASNIEISDYVTAVRALEYTTSTITNNRILTFG